MIAELFTSYFEGLASFFRGFGRMGMSEMIVLGVIIWLICSKRGRHCCGQRGQCRCQCGGCCRHRHSAHDHAHGSTPDEGSEAG